MWQQLTKRVINWLDPVNTSDTWKPAFGIGMVSLVLGISLLAFRVEQAAFTWIAGGYGLAFAGYWLLNRCPLVQRQFIVALGLSIVLRLLLVIPFPRLSDDIYRFVWDARLMLAGYHPFEQLPSDYKQQGFPVAGADEALYNQLNSPDYHTIYPPIAQVIFLAGVGLFPDNIAAAATVMKSIILLADVLCIVLLIQLLRGLDLPPSRVHLYALNPLVMAEGVGNLHFEPMMVCFLLASFVLLLKERWVSSAIAWAMAIATKLLPLIFLPLLLRRIPLTKWIPFWGSLALILCLLFIPLAEAVFIRHMGESLQLYFRRFEFNASFFYIFKTIGYWWRGKNEVALIGPSLALVTLLSILWLTYKEKTPQLAQLPAISLFAISIYLFNTTTVHPWYLIMPAALGVLTPYNYPFVWSAAVTLSYAHYSYQPWRENYWLIALSYMLVLLAILRDWYNCKVATEKSLLTDTTA
jgi:alpha-1,6-mannosyltransferase